MSDDDIHTGCDSRIQRLAELGDRLNDKWYLAAREAERATAERDAAIRERDEAREQVRRVRELHKDAGGFCAGCWEASRYDPRCLTHEALGGVAFTWSGDLGLALGRADGRALDGDGDSHE